MWMRLDPQELAALDRILAAAGTQRIGEEKDIDMLKERVEFYRDASDPTFINAVDTSDELEVDEDAVVSQGDEGAFVMCWAWVSNEDAGIEEDEDEEDDS